MEARYERPQFPVQARASPYCGSHQSNRFAMVVGCQSTFEKTPTDSFALCLLENRAR